MRRIGPANYALAAAALVPLVMLTGCAEGGGVRVEGPASTSVASPPASPSQEPAVKVDPIQLLTHDPKVGSEIKSDLKPCDGHEYPVDTSYGNVTRDTAPDVVINVSTCADGVGLGSYVYRMENGQYVDVFGDEQPPVYIDMNNGDLQLTRQVYAADDPVCCPSGEDVITYHWDGTRFTETSRTHSDYGTKANG
ncbi:LppP/LprE family lipoprotein [Streptomyces sp. RB6PN25]|uniref:LppP/LprE family lipoprotein n=1 Tax=Streptomyces humicola TaxID=2953240 RepID=A0ABT1PUZ6_9ACTN|nr:LppP/LprE family lipoprotein [Streptomyces humicola]MCQ4080978.1 LppP/LprE family lipoprotein [Streptomyces humicola]